MRMLYVIRTCWSNEPVIHTIGENLTWVISLKIKLASFRTCISCFFLLKLVIAKFCILISVKVISVKVISLHESKNFRSNFG